MKKKLLVVMLMTIVTTFAFAQNKDAIIGKWINPTGEGQIEIYKKVDKYFGKLVWIKEPNNEAGKPKTDDKNPNASLHNRPLLGLEILKDFVFDEDEWTDGTIYDPKTGKTYSCNMTLKSNGNLNIRGYIGISLIGRTETWKRIK